MQKIYNDKLTIEAISSKQNSPLRILTQEKFSKFLTTTEDNEENLETDESEIANEESEPKLDVVMQSLQNVAQLNKMIISAVA